MNYSIRNITTFVTSIFTLIFIVSSFLYTLQAFNFMNANNSQIRSIVKNWERSYIEDVFVSNSSNICPEGFENIINFEWPGTMHGWYWAATSSKASKLTKGSWDLKQVRKNCTTVDPIPKQKLTKFNGNIIWVKRVNTDLIDLSVPTPTGEWVNENHKVCGSIDGTTSYQTWIDKDLKCPITDFIIEDTESKNIQVSSYEKYQLGENKILFASRNSTHLPVVQFKLTEGGPCIEEHEYDTTNSKHFYKLLNKKPKGWKTKLEDGTLYDERFRYVDSISESDLLTQNNIFQELSLKPMNGNQTLSYFYTFSLYSWIF